MGARPSMPTAFLDRPPRSKFNGGDDSNASVCTTAPRSRAAGSAIFMAAICRAVTWSAQRYCCDGVCGHCTDGHGTPRVTHGTQDGAAHLDVAGLATRKHNDRPCQHLRPRSSSLVNWTGRGGCSVRSAEVARPMATWRTAEDTQVDF